MSVCKLRDSCTINDDRICEGCKHDYDYLSKYEHNGTSSIDVKDFCECCAHRDVERYNYPCRSCGKKFLSYYRPDDKSITNKIAGELEAENRRAKRQAETSGFAVGLVLGTVVSFVACAVATMVKFL